MTDDLRFDTRLTVLLRDDLLPWQALNVCAFLVSGLAASRPDLLGEPYEDADGARYLPMFRQPVTVLTGDLDLLRSAHGRALARRLPMSIYTMQLFATPHDDANRAAVRAVPTAELDLVGLAVHGARNAVDRALKGARMHP